MLKLTVPEKKQFFKSLITKTFLGAAVDMGWDKIYENRETLKHKSYLLYKDIIKNPGELGLDDEVVKMVVESISNRKVLKNRDLTEHNTAELLDPSDTREILLGGRNKAALLLHKKLDRLDKSRKLLDATTLTQLATTFGILFDKSQIILGQATENIAVMAKIKDGMTAEESLDALLKIREHETNQVGEA